MPSNTLQKLPEVSSPCPPAREQLLFTSLLCLTLCTWCASPMLWRDTPGARGSHAGQTKGSQHTAWRGKGQILETSLPQADRPGADPCLSTAGWMALLGPSQDVQENRGPPACSACVSETLPVFSSGNSLSLYIQTFFYQEGSNRGTLIIFPLQLFSLTLSYLYVLVSDRDSE